VLVLLLLLFFAKGWGWHTQVPCVISTELPEHPCIWAGYVFHQVGSKESVCYIFTAQQATVMVFCFAPGENCTPAVGKFTFSDVDVIPDCCRSENESYRTHQQRCTLCICKCIACIVSLMLSLWFGLESLAGGGGGGGGGELFSFRPVQLG
jgi:hypothetical protein